jgi:Flp pilus assembly protein TadG
MKRGFSSERGQVIPLVMFFALLLLAGGMIVFWIGFASASAANAQTAADAAALAGEKELVAELSSNQLGADGQYENAGFDTATVCAKAAGYASSNDASIISCQPVQDVNTGYGYDLKVVVKSNRKLPADAPDGGAGAYGYARASTDSFGADSPQIETTSDCDASIVSGAPFQSHGGMSGFFPAAGTDFSYGCEPKLAGAIDRLGQAQNLHLVGATGYQKNATGVASQLLGCGAAAIVHGLDHVSDQVLAQYGLTHPGDGEAQVLSLANINCTTTSSDASGGATTPLGNSNVHLVPWSGGPVGSGLLTGASGVVGPTSASQLQNACSIYAVWKQQSLPQGVLLMALDAATTESTMGANLYSPGAYGLFQQEPAEDWGTVQMELNPSVSTEMFIDGYGSNEGARYWYAQDPSAPTFALVQDVQHSGAGQASDGASNYGSNLGQAQQYESQVLGGACK